ncbi:hypothetical protein KDN24_23665 [Bacillus sp. Bva_UNVM-123]|uniref:hypothetical protein n=1 Tax=Bacillus sp. Bva_UNVM-123 TaxID=2829798 RepID=UPI00391F755C
MKYILIVLSANLASLSAILIHLSAKLGYLSAEFGLLSAKAPIKWINKYFYHKTSYNYIIPFTVKSNHRRIYPLRDGNSM